MGLLTETVGQSEESAPNFSQKHSKVQVLGHGQGDSTPAHQKTLIREIPNSPEAEKSVLGSLLRDPRLMDDISPILRAEHFFLPEHRWTWRALENLSGKGVGSWNVVIVKNELERMGKVKEAGGSLFLLQLVEHSPTTAYAVEHAKIVYEKWLRRELIDRLNDALIEAQTESNDPFDTMGYVRDKMGELEDGLSTTGITTYSQAVDAALERVVRISKLPPGEIPGITTGFIALDAMTGGFQNNDMITIGARPSMGKTSLLLNMAKTQAEAGKRVGILSLEMSAEQLAARTLLGKAGIDSIKMLRGGFTEEEFAMLVHYQERISRLPIYVEDSSGLSIRDIEIKSRILFKRYGVDILYLDYLQLVSGESKNQSRQQELGKISRGIKKLAMSYHVPVVALAQLNRSLESRSDKRPMLSDLREAGDFEQDSDVVMFLHRPEHYGIMVNEAGRATEGIAEIIIAKHRNGPTGVIELQYEKQFMLFRNLIDRDAPQTLPAPRHWADTERGRDVDSYADDNSDVPF